MPLVTTAFARGPWEKHRIWYELLHGARGNIIWDEKASSSAPDGSVGERGREAAPYYNEIRGGLGALIINSRAQRRAGRDPLFAGQHAHRMDARAAAARARPGSIASSATERQDSEFLRVRESYCRLIEDLGLQYDFVSYGQVEAGYSRSARLSGADSAPIQRVVGG